MAARAEEGGADGCFSPRELVKALVWVGAGAGVFAVSNNVNGMWGEVATPDCNRSETADVNDSKLDGLLQRYHVTVKLTMAIYVTTAMAAMITIVLLYCKYYLLRHTKQRLRLLLLAVSLLVLTVILTGVATPLHPLGCDGHWQLNNSGGILLNLLALICDLLAVALYIQQYRTEKREQETDTVPLLGNGGNSENVRGTGTENRHGSFPGERREQ